MKSIKLENNVPSSDGSTLSDLLANIRRVALHIKKSSQSWEKFKTVCDDVEVKPLRILLDVPTRWNSTHRMLERVLYLRKAVNHYILDHDEELTPVTEKQWELLELLCAFLWPFKNCTDALESTKKPEVDRVYWAYNRMFNEIDDLKATLARREGRRQNWSKELLVALVEMQEKLKKYYKKTGAPSVYVDAMILNPKIKLSGFKGPEWETVDAETYRQQARTRYMEQYANRHIQASSDDTTTSLKRKANQIDPDGERDDGDDYDRFVSSTFTESTTEAINEFDAWIAAPRENAKSTLAWYKQNGHKFPRLTLWMRDACAVPPSGSGVERQFSIAGRVATWQRNALSAQSICDIMMYKNHMDRMNVELAICDEAVYIDYEAITEAEVENSQEAAEAVKTIAEWRSGWNTGMKTR